ncbi:ATP-binding protein [Streptomyces sp. NPDC059568]|uniref:ATP-binding protein n=1 Tax=Streptomyces sp. NPDC059568 TaxID=3346868 RepID=UPI003682DECE
MTPLTQSAHPAQHTGVGIRDALHLSLSFRPDAQRPQQTRRIVGAVLRQGVGLGEDEVETVQLLVSELVTNAVVHAHSERVRFSVSYDLAGEVRIEVDDHSPARIQLRRPGPEEENGRGMLLVAALARAWGRRGTCTWCTVAVQEVADA